MARVPKFEDGIDRTRRHERQIGQLRQRATAHLTTRTFIVGGSITGLPTIPGVPACVNPTYVDATDADGRYVQETRELIEFSGFLASGTATISWQLDGTEVASHDLDTSMPGRLRLDDAILLTDSQIIVPVLVAADGADLSASFTTIVRPG